MKLTGRTAPVTGAARGLGFAIAEALSAEGAAVVLGDVLEEGAAGAERLTASGRSAIFVPLDVTQRADWDQAITGAIPLKRMGQPAEVGRVVAFLASDDANYVNGAELFVDGGLAMH